MHLPLLTGHPPAAVRRLAGQYATSFSTQRSTLIKKFFKLYWRSPNYSEQASARAGGACTVARAPERRNARRWWRA